MTNDTKHGRMWAYSVGWTTDGTIQKQVIWIKAHSVQEKSLPTRCSVARVARKAKVARYQQANSKEN